jgi:hypothetical protein
MTDTRTATRDRTLVSQAAIVVGVTFLAVGVLGFIPGLTTNYGDLKFGGHASDAKLLGVFEVSVLHNVVHLLFGVVGIAAGLRGRQAARTFLIGGGAVYLVLWVYGLVTGQESSANFVPLNAADDWLHLVLGAGMILLGLMWGREDARPGRSERTMA